MLAFPLHMAVMSDGSFPFGAVGLVHVENSIVQKRPIGIAEEMTIRVRPTPLQPHPKGKTFSLETDPDLYAEKFNPAQARHDFGRRSGTHPVPVRHRTDHNSPAEQRGATATSRPKPEPADSTNNLPTSDTGALPPAKDTFMDKVVTSTADAIADIADGASLSVGGFGLCGIPSVLISAIHEAGITDLEVISNNCGVDDWGLGILLSDKRIRRMVSSYVGGNKEFARQYLDGELEVEFTPQGTLAERLRAGGSGIPGFYTITGAGTQVADGGLPLRYHPDGTVAKVSAAKETRPFTVNGTTRNYILEEAITADFGLVRAWKGDRHGNLVFRQSSRNFNPLCAMAGTVTIAEVEELVEPGELGHDAIHLPGIYVHRVVPLTAQQVSQKRIEHRTLRPAAVTETRPVTELADKVA